MIKPVIFHWNIFFVYGAVRFQHVNFKQTCKQFKQTHKNGLKIHKNSNTKKIIKMWWILRNGGKYLWNGIYENVRIMRFLFISVWWTNLIYFLWRKSWTSTIWLQLSIEFVGWTGACVIINWKLVLTIKRPWPLIINRQMLGKSLCD